MNQTTNPEGHIFSGNIFIFQAFDISDDIDLERVRQSDETLVQPLQLSKHFKSYHTPLGIDLPHPHTSSRCIGAKLHNFGVISLAYKIPFKDTLENIKKNLNKIDDEFKEQSVTDAGSIFKKIKQYIKQARFFHLRTSYVVIQVDQQSEITVQDLKERYGGVIASLLHFEPVSLAEYQKEEILESAIGYYRGDLLVIGSEVAFVYDDEYQEILDLFEFANIQQLELQYFDRLLNRQLNVVYQRGELRILPIRAYVPFVGSRTMDPVRALNMLKVEISVITEQLESSIKIAGEPYVSELYEILVDKLEIKEWRESIEKKLKIIEDINEMYQNKIDTTRQDLLEVLIIILIFIELIVGILDYLK